MPHAIHRAGSRPGQTVNSNLNAFPSLMTAPLLLENGLFRDYNDPSRTVYMEAYMEQKLFTELRPLYVTSKESPYEIVTIQHPHCSEHFVFFAVGGQSGFTACPPPGTAQIRQISKLI